MARDYIYVNTDPGNPRYGEHYAVELHGSGEYHYYQESGGKDYVAYIDHQGGDTLAADWTPPGATGMPAAAPPPIAASPSPAPAAPTTTEQNNATPTSSQDAFNQDGQGGQLYNYPNGSKVWVGGAAGGGAASEANATAPVPSVSSQTSQPNVSIDSFPPANNETGGTAARATDASSGRTYTIVKDDTLSGIAASHGMTLQRIEELNPQFKNPDLILPGQKVNLGESAGFPTHSSYEQATPLTAGPNDPTGQGGAGGGWGDGKTESTDPAKNAIEASGKTETDPLKINHQPKD